MNVLKTIVTGIAASASLVVAVAIADEPAEDDQIIASFERAFNHEPAPSVVANNESVTRDVLYEKLNSIHWSSPEEIVEVLGGCQSEATEETVGKSEAVRSAYLARCIEKMARR